MCLHLHGTAFLRSLIFAFVFISMAAADALSKTVYMDPSGTYKTLQSAFGAMSAGDILIIRNGTYTGDANQIRYNLKPPSGTDSAYTVVMAENPGSVKFDGQNARSMFWGYGTFNMSYVKFEGLEYVNSTGGHDLTGAAHNNRTAHHIKFLRCGFEDNIAIQYSSYVLLEDCYVTGTGRYPYITFVSDHVVFRRCISRLDAGNGGGMPISNFINYASQYVEFQNCIAIDSDDNYYSNYEGVYGGFYTRKSYDIGGNTYASTNTAYRGCILLNVKHDQNGSGSPSEALSIGYGAQNLSFSDCLFWDMHNGMVIDNGLNNNFTVDHCTFGVTASGSFPGMLYDSNSYGDVTNSIFYGIYGTALRDIHESYNNCFYNNGVNKSGVGPSAGDITTVDPIDGSPGNGVPGLRHLLRIEGGSDLENAANDGGDVGATILKRIGVSGTLHGENGFAATTTDNLWPWPYENIVKAFFTGASIANTPPKTRGFCAAGQTLTKYIWEYLGNPIPPDIYTGVPPTAPLNLELTAQ